MCFADLEEREEALRHGRVYDIHGSPPYRDDRLVSAFDEPTKATIWNSLLAILVIVAVVGGLFWAGSAKAQTFPERGRAAVVDAAGVIPDAEERALNERIAKWVNVNGPQLAVATVPSLEGRDVKDYANRLFRKWGLGQGKEGSALSNGVLLLLAPNERKVRIEVGYGLEPVLTDALTGQIIRERIVPGLKANQIPQALSAGADAIMEAATPTAENPAPVVQASGQRRVWPWLLGVFLLAGGGGLLVFSRNARRRKEREEAERRYASLGTRRASPPTPSGFSFADIPPSTPRRSADPVRHTRPAPSYSPPPPPPSPSRRRDDDDSYSRSSSFGAGYGLGSSSSSSDYGSSSSSSSSYDSGSSSSGFDSGGGSSGGGGSDSSY